MKKQNNKGEIKNHPRFIEGEIKNPPRFVEEVFETEKIVKDVTILKKKNEGFLNPEKSRGDYEKNTDPIIFANNSILKCFNLVIIEQIDYQLYLDGKLENKIKIDFINKNYYYFKNKWPLMKKREFTIFTLPPPMTPIERVSI